jgi:hypothetical protein
MLFEDGYVLNQGFGDHGFGLDGLYGPSRFDTGEIVVVGRVAGAIYTDDFSAGQTGLEHILPVVSAENAFGGNFSDDTSVGHALSTGDSTDAAQGLILSGLGKEAEPLAIPLSEAADPLANLYLDHAGLSLSPVEPIYGDGPAMSGDEDFTPMIGGRPYESLSFLIIDTPFAYGDSHLTASLRPSVESLLGLADDGLDGWVLPTAGRGAWRLS